MNLIKCNECRKKSIVLVVFLLLTVCTPLAAQEDAASQYKRGLDYYNGDGVEQDYYKAVYWYEKSAEQGHTIAKEILKDWGY